jgi:hypothetical protein
LNNTLIEQWSGEKDWAYAEFNIPTGTHQFRWVYRKDISGTEGQDKAWIDYIIFPLSGGNAHEGPAKYVDTKTLDFSETRVNQTESQDFKIVNFGNRSLIGSISLPEGFTVSDSQNTNFNIQPDANVNFSVIFKPLEIKDYSGNIIITSNDTNTPEVIIPILADLTKQTTGEIISLTTELLGNFPNPFNPETTIRFSLSETTIVQIDIYNIRGQKVRTLVNDEYPAGIHNILWKGTDNYGRNMASGIYFYRFSTPDITQIQRMLLMK